MPHVSTPAAQSARLPTYFLSHGGGPWPYLDGPTRANITQLEASLKAIPAELKTNVAGLVTATDPTRGFDHGAFTTMFPMYPAADVPMVQLSIHHGHDPEAHLPLGRALTPLPDEGVLIVGSGLSHHNLRPFGPAAKGASAQFDAWLQNTLLRAGAAQRAAAPLERRPGRPPSPPTRRSFDPADGGCRRGRGRDRHLRSSRACLHGRSDGIELSLRRLACLSG